MDHFKNMSKQVICWMILLQILNMSVIPPHLTHPKSSPSAKMIKQSLKEYKSVYEWVAEGVFHKEVPESEEDEIDFSSPAFELYFFTGTCCKMPPVNFTIEHYSRYHSNAPSGHQEPHFPPPRFAA